MAENTCRIAQEPASELLPLSTGLHGRAFIVGARHDTGAGNACLSVTRELPAGPRPLPEGAGSGREKTEGRRGGARRPRLPVSWWVSSSTGWGRLGVGEELSGEGKRLQNFVLESFFLEDVHAGKKKWEMFHSSLLSILGSSNRFPCFPQVVRQEKS